MSYDYENLESPPDTPTLQLEDKLLKELECPVCMEYMIPPITLCESGHNICNKCKPKMKKCPTCRQSLLTVRNLTLEKLVQDVKYPCSNWRLGCKEVFAITEISLHNSICCQRFYICPLAKAPGNLCLWKGTRSEMKKHIDKNHKDRITVATSTLSVFIKEFNSTYKYCRVIYSLGEIFYQQFDVQANNFCFVIQHIGSEEEAANYKYEFLLSAKGGNEKIHISHVTQSIKTKIKDIYSSGKCVKLHFDVVKYFLQDNNMQFGMTISKVEDTDDSED